MNILLFYQLVITSGHQLRHAETTHTHTHTTSPMVVCYTGKSTWLVGGLNPGRARSSRLGLPVKTKSFFTAGIHTCACLCVFVSVGVNNTMDWQDKLEVCVQVQAWTVQHQIRHDRTEEEKLFLKNCREGEGLNYKTPLLDVRNSKFFGK